MSIPEVKMKNAEFYFWQLKRMILMAMFVALSVVGALLKIPSPTGTVALDAAPGFLGAAFLGWREGALIASLGHLISAYSAGFPLTLPIHLLVAVEMAVASGLYYFLARKSNLILAVLVVTVVNGVLMPLSFIPIFGAGFFYGMVVPLSIGAFINTLLAAFCYRALKKILPE